MNARTLTLAIAAALGATGALAADSSERTSMPAFCSERNVNCVLPENMGASGGGTPLRGTVGNNTFGGTSAQPGSSRSPTAATVERGRATGAASGAATGATGSSASGVVVIPPTDSSSNVTTVVTPPASSTGVGASTGGVTVPSVPALPGQVPTLTGNVPSLPSQVPTATTGGSATGTTSSTTTGTATGTTGGGTSASGAAATSGGAREGAARGGGAAGGGR